MKRKIFTALIFLATIALITVPFIILTLAAGTDTFGAGAIIDNVAPVISWVNNTVSAAPDSGTSKIIQIRFNATDANTVSDFNDSTAQMNITYGATTRTSGNCTSAGLTGTMDSWLCNISINYYDPPGAWNITAFIADNSGLTSTNTTSDFTMNTADYIDVVNASINFTGAPGATDVGPQNIIINNLGNINYGQINVTAINLLNGANVLGAGNFSVNVTNSANGQALSNNSKVQVTSANITRGAGSNEELFFYLDIPSTLATGTYSAPASWTIDAGQ